MWETPAKLLEWVQNTFRQLAGKDLESENITSTEDELVSVQCQLWRDAEIGIKQSNKTTVRLRVVCKKNRILSFEYVRSDTPTTQEARLFCWDPQTKDFELDADSKTLDMRQLENGVWIRFWRAIKERASATPSVANPVSRQKRETILREQQQSIAKMLRSYGYEEADDGDDEYSFFYNRSSDWQVEMRFPRSGNWIFTLQDDQENHLIDADWDLYYRNFSLDYELEGQRFHTSSTEDNERIADWFTRLKVRIEALHSPQPRLGCSVCGTPTDQECGKCSSTYCSLKCSNSDPKHPAICNFVRSQDDPEEDVAR